ncbi:hypothetical protein [Roseateles sp.]|uniref:hypothetical protein n=1 Tax=Roseateles sp. TaxID=1971397 RepID=UPI0039E98223
MNAAMSADVRAHALELAATIREALVHLVDRESSSIRSILPEALVSVEAAVSGHAGVRVACDALRALLAGGRPAPQPTLAALDGLDQALAAALQPFSGVKSASWGPGQRLPQEDGALAPGGASELLHGTPPESRGDEAPPPFAHREAYADYFSRLAQSRPSPAVLRRLLPHLDAALDGAERLALWQALWSCVSVLPEGEVERVAACLDGRYADALRPLRQEWSAPELIEHLCGQGDFDVQTTLTPVLLNHHGLDPLAAPAGHGAGLLLQAARAELAQAPRQLEPSRAARLERALAQAQAIDPSVMPQALALRFELALAADAEEVATGILARLLQAGEGHRLRADRVRAWLDGSAFGAADVQRCPPLQLAPGLQAGWLQPARWGGVAVLQVLQQAMSREIPRQRLQALAAHVAALGEPVVPPASPAPQALQLLTILDKAYALIEGGGDAVPLLRELLHRQAFAPSALAWIWRASASWHAARGDAESELLALTQARRYMSDDALRTRLSRCLPPKAPQPGCDWREEEAGWQALAQRGKAAEQRTAVLQLATLYTDGQLEPGSPYRRQQADLAQPLWRGLLADARYAPLAQAALAEPLQTLLRPAWQQGHGEDYLWFERPGARGVFIVFSCMATYFGFTEVAALQGALKDRHLMFVRCPDKNWYSDASFERVQALLRERVAAHFAAADVCCWYGSMGGHAALKFALSFGWQAVVFNPQTDLDLWAAFRPKERAELWGADRHASLDAWPVEAWEQVPLYYACGAWSADREALSMVLRRLRQCRRLDVVIEKFDDLNHAGLMNRICTGAPTLTLERICQRLRALPLLPPAEGPGLVGADAQQFWEKLDEARAAKVEIQVRDGRLRWRPSQDCSTR